MKIAVALVMLAGAAGAQERTFDPAPTVACLAQADVSSTEALDCIGKAANACMLQPYGDDTIGRVYCLNAEREWWDARLNATYGQLMAEHKAADAEMTGLGATVPSLADSLKAMQRAWIPFRDATCDYERATWSNGSGRGPATAGCLMVQTGRQALSLEARLGQ